MDREFVILNGKAKIKLEFEPLDKSLVHALFKNDIVAFAFVFSAIHREVCIAENLVRSGDIGSALSDADARAHKNFFPVDYQRLTENSLNALGDHHRLVGVVYRLDQNREFVTAETGGRIAAPKAI